MYYIIGRGGETIKDLAIQSGCKMNMIQDGPYVNAPEKPLRMHGTRFAINKARELVSGLMQQEVNFLNISCFLLSLLSRARILSLFSSMVGASTSKVYYVNFCLWSQDIFRYKGSVCISVAMM